MTDTTTAVTPATDEEIEAWTRTIIDAIEYAPPWMLAKAFARIDAERQQHAIARRQLNSETERWGKVIAERDATIARLRMALEKMAYIPGMADLEPYAVALARAALEDSRE